MQTIQSLFDFSETHILVTGSAGNIGSAISRRLADAGARVALHYHSNADQARALRDALGNHAVAVQADLSRVQDIEAMFETLAEQGFTLNGVVNNAADQSLATLSELSIAQWRQMMAINLDSVMLICQHAIKQFAKGGSIVNISSIESLDPAHGHAHYATSKAGLNMLTRAFALEHGHQGVRVNSISPGLIHRRGIETDWPEGVTRWQDRAPLNRLGTPADVADATLFLLSDAARWITGTNLVVDGGMSAQNKW